MGGWVNSKTSSHLSGMPSHAKQAIRESVSAGPKSEDCVPLLPGRSLFIVANRAKENSDKSSLFALFPGSAFRGFNRSFTHSVGTKRPLILYVLSKMRWRL
jgi:hypothetical protein